MRIKEVTVHTALVIIHTATKSKDNREISIKVFSEIQQWLPLKEQNLLLIFLIVLLQPTSSFSYCCFKVNRIV